MKRLFVLIFVGSFFLGQQAILSAESQIDYLLSNKTAKDDSVFVERVIRADTLLLENGKKIKLIGLKAPAAPRKKYPKTDSRGIVIEEVSPLTSVEEQAFDYAQSLLANQQVHLEYDTQSKDENFYTLAYVFLPDGTFVNAEILRRGYADLTLAPPNTKYADRLRQAYQEARKEKRGIHGE